MTVRSAPMPLWCRTRPGRVGATGVPAHQTAVPRRRPDDERRIADDPDAWVDPAMYI